MNAHARDRPGKAFYSIVYNGDGTADVYLRPEVTAYQTPVGVTEYDVRVRVIRGLAPWDGMEEDIREHYSIWRASAEVIDL